jgi:hypothetical protein
METPRRVAKKYVFDLWKGRYDAPCLKLHLFPVMDMMVL